MTMSIQEANIYPTHECFDDALENLIYIMKKEGTGIVKRGGLLIVHGIISPDGKDIAHAWLEREGKIVYFSGIYSGKKVLVSCALDEYYKNSVVKETTKYTLFQAYAEEIRTGHYGPWVERYKALCNDSSDSNTAVT